MISLTEEQLQDLASFVYQFIIQHLIPSLEQEKPLTEQDKEVIRMMAAACSMSAPAAITYLNNLEAAGHFRKSPFQN